MKTDKQAIEEMAKDLACNICWDEDEIPTINCLETATRLFIKGYRKESDNVIELPCKIGDTVYIIDEADDECGEDYVLAVKVLQFFINEHGIAIELALPIGMRLGTWMVVGKNVFLTREEAEAKMKGGAEG